MLRAFLQHCRHGLRGLGRNPGFACAAILTLALGIGANTAIFSVIDSLLLKALPVREPEQLVLVSSGERSSRSWSYAVWEQLRDLQLIDEAFAWSSVRLDLAESGQTDFVDGLLVSGNFFQVIGVRAMLGRTFSEADDAIGGGPDGPVAVISYGFWQRRFGGSRDVLGRTITVERVPLTIIGVTPAYFFGLEVGLSFDAVLPLAAAPLMPRQQARLQNRLDSLLGIWGRFGPGRSVDAATAALRQAQVEIREATMPDYVRVQDRDAYLREPFSVVSAGTGISFLQGRYERPLVIILVIVALVLLIACVNVANLLLARAAGRWREFGVRVALGASRLRLARQLLVESLLLSTFGAAIGLLVGSWGSRLLVRQFATQYIGNPFSPPSSNIFLDVSLNWRALVFTAAVAVATTVLFGTAPAWQATRVDPIESLHERRLWREGYARIGTGHVLVVAQVALSLVLLVGAGLFIRTFYALANIDLGFQPDRVLIVPVDVRRSTLASPSNGLILDSNPKLAALLDRATEAARSVPGVESAAAASVIPITGLVMTTAIEPPDAPLLAESDRIVHKNVVTPDWFRTMGTRLLAGRDFETRDRDGATRVAIVSEAFASRFFNGTNPVGRLVWEGWPEPDDDQLEIVGVVEDMVYRGIRETAPPTIYIPVAQSEGNDILPAFSVIVRPASGATASVARSVAAAISELDRDLSVTVRSLAAHVTGQFNHERVTAKLGGVFGALALLLVAVGQYGVTAQAVTRRQIEIGIRMALGANPRAIVRMVVSRVAAAMALGVVLGGVASLWAVRFVQALLFNLPARDLPVFAAAAAVLIVVAAAASWLPARRAARLDPATVLRAE